MLPSDTISSLWLYCLALVLLLQSVDGILQTAQLDVFTRANAEGPSYTLLVSQASFGSYPRMSNEQKHGLSLAPDENPLLCQNVTEPLASVTNKAMLVPRGVCSFETKAMNAQRLGASSVIVYGALASRYSLNETNQTDYEYTEADILYPLEHYDYDCSYGQASIPAHLISMEPLPYNAAQNDPLLSGNTSENLCRANSVDNLAQCPSQSCLLTGVKNDDEHYQACCAWDLHIWLYADDTFNGSEVHIPAVYTTLAQANQLLHDLQTYPDLELVLTARWRSAYNPSSYLIWALGVFVAGLAAYLSASDYHKVIRRYRRRPASSSSRAPSSRTGERSEPPPPPAEDSMELTAVHALVFIVMASASLLILFYFQIYNVVKVMYAMGCSKAVSQVIAYPILRMVMKHWQWRDRIVWRTGTEDFGDISVRDILAHAMGYSLGLAWLLTAFCVRHPENLPFFWITQDIFGAAMCIMFLQVIKLNSIRVASILLMVAFFYDIFFVFVTPLLFKGKSVMIAVATSGGPPKADPLWCEKYPDDRDCQGGDPLPMLFTIPRINDYQGGSSLLGLGDIVLPGLLLSFAARFDAAKSLLGVMGGGNGTIQSPSCPERKFCGDCGLCSGGYFAPLIVAYAVGLFMANAAVYLMQMGQPALLYLVPCCLGTMAYIGWRRGEVKDLWDGPKAIRAADAVLYYREGANSMHAPLPTEEGLETTSVPSAIEDNDQ